MHASPAKLPERLSKASAIDEKGHFFMYVAAS
jgi:hypothetical protein